MIRHIKMPALKLLRLLGVNRVVIESPWRSSRLTILCYHGVSLADEHCWRPALYINREQFLSRMRVLRKRRCSVLTLGDALDRLADGNLPKRAVCITFDDGFYDFYAVARPILREFCFPATVYLTTYYSNHPDQPIFDVMLPYALWKSQGAILDLPDILPHRILLQGGGCDSAFDAIQAYCSAHALSGPERHELLKTICRKIDFELSDAIRQRLLCLMRGEEVARAASEGFEIQLHTHRHRILGNREMFLADLAENSEAIQRLTGTKPTQFCYPGNFRPPDLREWLQAGGIRSATTCDSGLASAASDRYLLPRIMDLSSTKELEFDAWICGLAHFFPKRAYPPSFSQAQLEEFPGKLARAG
jgi:peptidoglycan/xylan/chitin deacetylase (PgdA/CDA1 family)